MNIPSLALLRARLRRIARFEVHAYFRRRPLRANSVLYEAFSGNGMLCNPEAIFRELLAAPDMQHLHHIWALSGGSEYRSAVAEFADDPRVSLVRHGSRAYLRAIATSGYLVNNATFPPYFSKRPGQTYVNTWHGTPLKKMGYDMPDGANEASNVLRNFLAADYLIAANPVMSDMYWRAYRLRGIYRGTVIEAGYPRIDRQLLTDDATARERQRLVDAGLPLGDRKIILYAPTWKGSTFSRSVDDLDDLLAHASELTSRIDSEKYIVLIKTHQSIFASGKDRPGARGILVPNEIPTNVVLGLTSILVTDYSSIAYDFLATGRPVLYFIPDLQDYEGTRGLYVDPQDWPGPVCHTVAELSAAVAGSELAGLTESRERYRAAQRTMVPHEDGQSTRRVVDVVFRGVQDGARLERGVSDGRTSMLIYLGGMSSNGITAAGLNLLATLDHDRFDVSVFYPNRLTGDARSNQLSIDPRVRQFPRVGGMNGSKVLHLARRVNYRLGRMSSHMLVPSQKQLWDDEWVRCFGPDTRFDHVVDFSGYGPFWTALLLHAPGASRSIWLHNDLAADAHRVVRGRKRMLHSLTQVFSLYASYDRLVSVSAELAAINQAELAEFGAQGQFVWASNTIDAARVVSESRETVGGVEGEFLSRVGMTTFVTVGRLSPEKNQARLIRAFGRVHQQDEATQLLIVGAGALADELSELVEGLQLSGSVLFSGHNDNPHALMAASDCFVLSSDYEGQPMVLLEAQIVGIPIVTVDFASVRGALPAGTGLVVDQTDESLADGMMAFLRGEVPAPLFDPVAYQQEAIDSFVATLGLLPGPEAPQH